MEIVDQSPDSRLVVSENCRARMDGITRRALDDRVHRLYLLMMAIPVIQLGYRHQLGPSDLFRTYHVAATSDVWEQISPCAPSPVTTSISHYHPALSARRTLRLALHSAQEHVVTAWDSCLLTSHNELRVRAHRDGPYPEYSHRAACPTAGICDRLGGSVAGVRKGHRFFLTPASSRNLRCILPSTFMRSSRLQACDRVVWFGTCCNSSTAQTLSVINRIYSVITVKTL